MANLPIFESTGDKELDNLITWFRSSYDYEKPWREVANVWYDFYHGKQIDEELRAELEARSQPDIVMNHIAPTINLIIGQEAGTRRDVVFLPTEPSDTGMAHVVTDLYHQRAKKDDLNFKLTDAFIDGLVTGRGWIFVKSDKVDEKKKDVFFEYIPWYEVYVDPLSKKPDYSDAKYITRCIWADRKDILAMYPEKAMELNQISNDDTSVAQDELPFGNTGFGSNAYTNEKDDIIWIDHKRNRMRICEIWWEEQTDKKKKVVKNAIFTGGVFLQSPKESPYKHNKFPFVPVFGDRDRDGFPYGKVKDLIPIQEMINKMHSKSMHIMATNRVIYEEGSFLNVEQAKVELSRADGMIPVQAGTLTNRKIERDKDITGADLALKLYSDAISSMERVSGVNAELKGQASSNARSGFAIQLRQNQGMTILGRLFDNLSRSRKKIAELSLFIMGQYYNDQRVVRVLGEKGQQQFLQLNAEDENGFPINSIKDVFKFDVIISDSPEYTNTDSEQFSALGEILKGVLPNNPELLAQFMLTSNLKNKEQLAEAARQQFSPQQQQPQ